MWNLRKTKENENRFTDMKDKCVVVARRRGAAAVGKIGEGD